MQILEVNKCFVVRIGGGVEVGWRLTGSIPSVLSQSERKSILESLDRGKYLEVVTASREAWVAMRPNLMAQLGLDG